MGTLNTFDALKTIVESVAKDLELDGVITIDGAHRMYNILVSCNQEYSSTYLKEVTKRIATVCFSRSETTFFKYVYKGVLLYKIQGTLKSSEEEYKEVI